MKTILIPVFDGMVGRNILHTDVLKILKESGVRIVIIPPKNKADYYEKEFADGKQIFVEKSPCFKHDRMEFLVTGLFLHSIPTNFMRVRQRDWYLNKGKYVHYLGTSMLRFLGHFSFWHRLIRAFDAMLPIPSYLYEVFNRWQPDVIFAPTMITRDEIGLMRIAKRHGKKNIGMVKSWDNLTSKAFLRFFPDYIIVHNEIVKREATQIYGYPEEKLVITGIPQFDQYANPNFHEKRQEFFQKLGLNQEKHLILYAPAGDWMSTYDKEVLSMLLDWIDEGQLPNSEVLLRLHPAYESKTEELKGRKNLIVERPGLHLKGTKTDSSLKEVEFGFDEIKHLASSIYYSSITVNTASTMSIEAAVFDRPIILIAFDGNHKLPYWHSVRRYYDREHYLPIVKSGGAILVKSKEEFLIALKTYLADQTLHNKGRTRIREEQCYKLDGKSGKRVAKFIISTLN